MIVKKRNHHGKIIDAIVIVALKDRKDRKGFKDLLELLGRPDRLANKAFKGLKDPKASQD